MLVSDLVDSGQFDVVVAACLHRAGDAIRWVHVTDLPDPSPYLRGGELILTSALWFSGPASSESFVAALAASDVHALGIALYGEEPLPEGLAQACEDHDVALLQFADDVVDAGRVLSCCRSGHRRQQAAAQTEDGPGPIEMPTCHGSIMASAPNRCNLEVGQWSGTGRPDPLEQLAGPVFL